MLLATPETTRKYIEPINISIKFCPKPKQHTSRGIIVCPSLYNIGVKVVPKYHLLFSIK